MKTDIKTIAAAAGLSLTSHGNLELGSNDQGDHGSPGGHASNSAVTFYLLPWGDVRAVIDNRSGSNQGCIEWQRGSVAKLDGANLPEAIALAQDHIASLDDAQLMRAWRIASIHARDAMWRIEAATNPSPDPEHAALLAVAQAAESAADWLNQCTPGTDQHERGQAITKALAALEAVRGETVESTNPQ